MSYSLIQSGDAPYEVLKLIASNTAVSQYVMEFFKPRCDCDVVEWVKNKIYAGDAEVMASIRALIAKNNVTAPPGPVNSINGAGGDAFVLVRTWCTSTSRFGEFVNDDGTKFEALIQTLAPGC